MVRFPASGVLVFAVPNDGRGSGVAAEAAAARVLADTGVPAARVVAGPTRIDGWWATAWTDLRPTSDGPVGASEVGRLAGLLHGATSGFGVERGPDLLRCDPLDAALAQLAAARDRFAADDLDWLVGRAERLRPRWEEGVRASSHAVIHGDLHAANVVRTATGPVLVDLELAGWGPVAYDAAPTVASVRHYGCPEADLDAFDAAYGGTLARRGTAADLADVWSLWSTAWAVANAHRSAALLDEASVRVTTLRTGHRPRDWRLS